jgi:hypothetical protein
MIVNCLIFKGLWGMFTFVNPWKISYVNFFVYFCKQKD